MTFSQYLKMLFPYLGSRTCDATLPKRKTSKQNSPASQGTQGDFVVYIVNAFIEDGSDDFCKIINAKPDTLRKTYSGSIELSNANAQYILHHMDKQRYIETIDIDSLSYDAVESLSTTLRENGVDNDGTTTDIASKCADLLEQIIISSAGSTDHRSIEESCAALEALIDKLPKPKKIDPPPIPVDHEHGYISALYAAYGDAAGVKPFGEQELQQYAEYGEDFQERRIDYFAAESIRRSIVELKGIELNSQFDVLKDEMYSGVRSKALMRYDNGFLKMLGVMDRAVTISPNQYILSRSPYWISNHIKMGVCHFLVNEGKLWWVSNDD